MTDWKQKYEDSLVAFDKVKVELDASRAKVVLVRDELRALEARVHAVISALSPVRE